MALLMRLTHNQDLRMSMIQELRIPSKFIMTCFPITEELLKTNKSEVLKAYDWNPYLIRKTKYKSVMDMVLCNLFPYYKLSCKRFYKGEDESMIGLYTVPQLTFIDRQLAEQVKKQLKTLKEETFQNL